MRITFDSSILVAAHISRAGVCAELLEQVLLGHELVLSEFIPSKLREKSSGKFGYPDATVRAVVSHLKRSAEFVQPEETPSDACRDRNDLAVLGTATAGGAAYRSLSIRTSW